MTPGQFVQATSSTGEVVTNDYPQITLDLSTEWTEFHRADAPQLIPADRAELDQLIEEIYRDVNNGVYRCGFATSQEAYDAGVRRAVRAARRTGGTAGGPDLPPR